MSSPTAVRSLSPHSPHLRQRDRRRQGAGRWPALSLFALALSAAPAAQAASCPSLTIVLERSEDMLQDMSGSPVVPEESRQRWGVAKAAIARAVAAYNNKLPIGLTFFPSDDLCGSASDLRVPPAYDTKAAIANALADGSFSPDGGGTPTCGAVGRAALSLSQQTRDSYLLLVTGGLPTCDAICSVDPRDPASSAVSAVSAAARGSHPVKTFVLAIGSQDPGEREGLGRMAVAGGVPDSKNPNLKFFGADDVTALDAAFERIMHQLTYDGDGVACDDSCTRAGCPSPTEVCVQGRCLNNPCRDLACRAGEYCLSTGTAARCAAPCDKPCAAGTRCSAGQCVHEDCEAPCGPGNRCQPAAAGADQPGACVPDEACSGIACPDGQGCFAGVCREDPCLYTTCPDGLSCIPFDGSCVVQGLLPSQAGVEDHLEAGCAVSARASRTTALPAAGLTALALLLGFGRRRRRTAAVIHTARI
jgi:hypothetical protein